jgi:phage tail-like protein
MPKISNPRKKFNFRIEIDGVDQWEVQKVTIPEAEIAVVAHGDSNSDVKTGGRVNFSNLVMEKLKATAESDKAIWLWMKSVQDAATGGGLLPIAYKRIITIKEMDTTGTQAIRKHVCFGCFPVKKTVSELDRQADENTMDTIEFSVDSVEEL